MMNLSANLAKIRERLAAAAERSGRSAAEVTLIAVSKTRSVEEITAAAAAGATEYGENYVQELTAKQAALPELNWHFIGHLQSNKVRAIVPFCALIHVVDSARLAEEISRRATAVGRVQPVLLQVDLAGEATKFGCPESALAPVIEAVRNLPGVDWQGLMTIPPLGSEPEQSRPYYRRLATLREELLGQGLPPANVRHLSMGMSHDYEVAIEEGATLVRIGTAIFGPRR